MLFQERAPRRFGWVSCDDWLNRELINHSLQLCARSARRAQSLQCLGQRPALRAIRRVQFIVAFTPDAMILLRDVGQLKVNRKGTDHADGVIKNKVAE